MGGSTAAVVECPVCGSLVAEEVINEHIDSDCKLLKAPVASSSKVPSAGLAPVFQAGASSSATSSSKRRQSSDHPSSTGTSRKRHGSPPSSTAKDRGGDKRPALITGGALGPARRKRQSSPLSSSQRPDADKKPRLTSAGAVKSVQPLAERLRPRSLDEFFGHDGLLSPSNGALRALVTSNTLGSALFWGPPGTGKTTLASLIAAHTSSSYHALSATSASIQDVRKVIDGALNQLRLTGKRTLLFVDELHRFTKSQLDVFLPSVESGTIQLIGATSENPSFTINRALLSRLKIFALDKLSTEALKSVLRRGVLLWKAEQTGEAWLDAREGEDAVPGMDEEMLEYLAGIADGDCRVALNSLETALQLIAHRFSTSDPTTPLAPTEKHELLAALKSTLSLRYDRTGDARYDMISALHKSLRGSDGSAAMYWLARMLTAGEDPLYICRRLVVFASEDVGLADAHALPLAAATLTACQQVGMPECRINLAHCVAYLAEAKKSTRSYVAYNAAVKACGTERQYEVPPNIRNAPTKLAKDLGHGEGYAYDPSFAHPVTNTFLPPELAHASSFSADEGARFLQPEGSTAGKQWDEGKLAEWERTRNGGLRWDGRDGRQGGGET